MVNGVGKYQNSEITQKLRSKTDYNFYKDDYEKISNNFRTVIKLLKENEKNFKKILKNYKFQGNELSLQDFKLWCNREFPKYKKNDKMIEVLFKGKNLIYKSWKSTKPFYNQILKK